MTEHNWLKHNPYYRFEWLLLIAGSLLPFSFSPYNLVWLQLPLLATLFILCVGQDSRRIFLRVLLFFFASFAHGIHWIFYSLHYHGGSPLVLAVIMVVLLSLYLALYPALMMALVGRYIRATPVIFLSLLFPVALTLGDWLRGYVLTGFPWLQLGTAYVDTPVAGFMPVFGGLGSGLVGSMFAGLLGLFVFRPATRIASAGMVMVLLLAGYLLLEVSWTQPRDEPIQVSMVQGNIPQSEKWKSENYLPTLNMYRQLSLRHPDSDLIIWPETAIPGFRYYVEHYLEGLRQFARETNSEFLMGVFTQQENGGRYYNSVITLDGQVYLKRHLVPLGEYFPLRGLLGFFANWVDIPMSDIDHGDSRQPLIQVAGQVVGVNICFEDAFDRDVRLDVPEASLLVNVSNDAWFEDSPQPWQHHQIARVRALESGRSLIRSTNTGVTAIIDPKGRVQAQLPQFTRDVLTAKVQAYEGSTPYVRWGNYLLVSLMMVVLVMFFYRGRFS